MENGQYVDGSIWFYAPNKGAPVFFAAAFAASGLCHAWQCVHYRSWRLTGFYPVCAALFTGGFVARELGAFDDSNLIKYIVSICLVYAAPPVFELANYNILGRILYYVPQHSPVHPGRVITTFAAVSAVVEALNGNGASRSANQSLPQRQQDVGHSLLKAALLLQLFVVAAFLLLAGTFHRRLWRAGVIGHGAGAPLASALATLYASTALLTARTIFRVAEYFSVADLHVGPGFDPASLSPLVRYEWFFYVFEASLMLANQVLMNVRHPRRYLPPSTKTYLAPDGREVTGPGYKDDRSTWLTVVDPFDLWGLARGRDKTRRFWEADAPAEAEAEPKATDPETRATDPEAAV